MKRNNKKNMLLSFVILLALIIGIGYAYLTSNLSISGQTEIADNTWNIHFENLNIKEGSIEPVTAATINSSDNTKITYSVKLNKPKDYYEFTVDIKNDGTLPGKISLYETTGINTSTQSYLEHSVTYTNNKPIQIGDILDPGDKDTIRVKLRYKDDISASDLPSTNTILNIVINIDYTQSSTLEGYHCTYNGTLQQGSEYVEGQYTYRYKQEYQIGSTADWVNITDDGWGVHLTDSSSTAPITSRMCTTINGKPIVSTSMLYFESASSSVDLSSVNTKYVTNTTGMFARTNFTNLDITNLDVGNVTNMDGMFLSTVTSSLNLNYFDTSKVTNMYQMFAGIEVNSLDLSKLDTSNVTNMSGLFFYSDIGTLNLNNLNTSKVTNMEDMFTSSTMTTLDLSSFDTSNVTNMTAMFEESQASTINLSSFNTSKVTDMSFMFSDMPNLQSIDLSNFDTSNVTNMNGMFNKIKVPVLDLSSFDTTKVTSTIEMFKLSTTTTGYARTQADANKFNSSSGKPSTLTFTLKN